MRILLADDSRAMRIVFREVFQKLGHVPADILEAPDWSLARSALRAGPFDLIVFDWDLPGLNGADPAWQLKELGVSGKITVLFCVSRQQRPLLASAARLGPCDFIERPFTQEAFEAKVRGLGLALEAKKASSRQLLAVPPPPAPTKESSRRLHPAPGPSSPESAKDFLSQLPSNVRDDLFKLAMPGRHEPGVVILRAGELSATLRFVVQGQVEVLQGAAGQLAKVLVEGDPVGELSFMTHQPSAETFRAKTRVLTASLSKANVDELLRKQPVMAIHLSALMGRHSRVMTARATTLEHSDFKGTFDTMPFADVIQMLIATKKTGVLGVRGEEDRGAVYFEDGEAIHAWTDDLQGEPAFYAVSGWRKAKFAFTSIERKEPRTLVQPTITILMKAMRRLEEGAAAGGAPKAF